MSEIRDIASLHLKVNSEEAKRDFEAVKKKVKELKEEIIEASKKGDFEQVEKLHKQLKPAIKEMDSMLTNIGRIDAAMKNLSLQTPKELRRTLTLINAEMNSGKIVVGSEQWKGYEEQLKKVKMRLKELNDAQKVVTDAGLSFKDMLDIGGNVSMITASILDLKDSVTEFLRDNVNSYIELDAEMANVQKFTGLARESVDELNAEFKKIDTRTSIIELNKLAEEAGRLGKTSQEDILGFVKAADIINVALDDLGEGATLEISKLTNIFGDEKALGTEKSMLAVGSVINELSQNCTAAAPYLANFTKRLAGVGAQADMTIPQIMGFAAVLDSQGQAVEMSATAVSQLITKMFQDPAKIAKAVGLDIQEFTNLVKTDTNAALLTLLERLNSFGSMDVLAPLFKEMGTDGARASAVLASLAGNIDMVREQQEIATQAYNEATSVVKEFTVQNETEEAKLEKKRKKLEEVKVALGKELLPVMGELTSTGTMLIKLSTTVIKFVKEHHKLIISAAAGIAAYTITVKAHTIATKATTVATKAWNLVTKAGTTLQGAYKIILLATTLCYAKLTGNIVKATAAQRALNLVMKANPVGLIVGGITAAATALFSYSKRNEEAAQKERELAEERKRAAEEEKRRVAGMTDISQMAADNAKKELAELEKLYNATQDETIAKEERLSAANELIKQYPEYFKQLNAEIIITGQVKDVYDKLTQSILMTAKARAAQSKIEENYGRIIELEFKKEERRKELEARDQRYLDKVKPGEEVTDAVGSGRSRTDRMEFISNGIGSSNGGWYWMDDALEYHTQRLQKSRERTLDYEFRELEELYNANKKLESIIKTTKTSDGGGSGGDSEKEPKAWREKEDAINRTAYAIGHINYEAFLKKKHEILIEYYNRMLQSTSLSENERLVLLAEKAEAEQDWEEKQNEAKEKRNAEALKRSLEGIDKKYQQTKARETAWCYDIANENYGNEKILNEKLFQANVEYLKEKEQLYRDSGKDDEADKILLEREILVNNEKLRKHKEFLASYRRLQNEYLHITNEEKMQAELATLDALKTEGIIKEEEYQELKLKIQEKYSSNKDVDNFKRKYLTTEEQLEQELEQLEKFYTEGAIKEEEYQQLKIKIQEKYSKKEEKQKFSDGGYGDMLTNIYESWNELINGTTDNSLSNMERIAKAAQATWAIAGAALEQYSAYSQACCDVEVAEIEKKYDKMIAAAGRNSARSKLLEEKKEKEIAKVKTKYSKQAQKMEIAGAVAQTAVAAINAYASASKEHWLLGPIAAAMAIAAGAVQIATIQKQHQAQQAGYYTGGFTRKSADDREEVGVVHANEFVANAQATRNPVLSPFFSLVDYAQRNNTVGSLTADDVSHALGTGAVVKATSTTANESVQNSGELLAVAGSISSNTKVVQRLNERLDEGIEAFMVMDGERGFDKKYSDYNRLKNNPKR